MFIDTHAHLDFPEYSSDREGVISRARSEGVDFIINVGTTVEGSRASLELAGKYDFIYAAIAVHPHYAGDIEDRHLREMEEMGSSQKVVAIGETGLDFYKDISPRKTQEAIFRSFIRIARRLKLPLIIHSREASEDTLKILKEEKGEEYGGVLHCYSYPWSVAEHLLHMGFYISVAGQVTFPTSHALREVVKKIPPERMLLETDCPFLAPQPFRGKRNEPAYVKHIAHQLSQIYGLSTEDIARISTLNARHLFGLGGDSSDTGVIAYPIRDSLYLNITNRCTNECRFCVRFFTHYVKGHNLRLEKEPSLEDVLSAMSPFRGRYREVVFCGLGEPMLRLDLIKEISRQLKRDKVYIRLNTNGQGNLIHKRNVVPELSGLIDEVSVSLNAESAELYNRLCPSQFGPATYEKVKEFILECKRYIPCVGITVLDMPEVNIEACRDIARNLGVKFRIRRYNVVG